MLQSKHKRNKVLEPTINPEKEAQAAVEQVMSRQKKPGRKALQIFAVIVLLLLVAGGVYAWQNNRVAQLENQVTELKKETTPETKAVVADPYAGWKTYTTKYEKITFKYPPSFALDAVSTPKGPGEESNTDRISLVGKNKFNMVFQAGNFNPGADCMTCGVQLAEPINLLGRSYSLNYVSNEGVDAKISAIIVADKANDPFGPLKGKNIIGSDGMPSYMMLHFSYQPDGTDTIITTPLNKLKTDEQVKTAKQILESFSY